MTFTPITWTDGTTPVDASNMNRIETGISDAAGDLDTLSETLNAQNLFASGTSLTSGTDLNDITTYGRYNVGSSSAASSIVNTPMTSSGYSLFVFPSGGQRTQLAVMGGQNSNTNANWIYIRNMNSSNTWTNWYVISGTQQ